MPSHTNRCRLYKLVETIIGAQAKWAYKFTYRLLPFNGVVVEPRAAGHAWSVLPRYGRGPLHLVTNDL